MLQGSGTAGHSPLNSDKRPATDRQGDIVNIIIMLLLRLVYTVQKCDTIILLFIANDVISSFLQRDARTVKRGIAIVSRPSVCS